MKSDNFIKKIDDICAERGITRNKLASMAGISSGTLSLIASGARKPGADLCLSLANALKIPPETVLRWAGFLPDESEVSGQGEMAYIYANLPPEKQEQLREYARFLIEKEEKKTGATPAPRAIG
jgi:transcriptional regulator with XRE-family HTH domain